MIEAVIYHNKNKQPCGYCILGHAGFAKKGEDIVCSAVSILAINTINAIEVLANTPFYCNAKEEEGGYLEVVVTDLKQCKQVHDAELLLKTMILGLESIAEQYKKYIRLTHKEV